MTLIKSILFYILLPTATSVAVWVFRWTFSSPHHQILDAKMTFMDSMGGGGGRLSICPS